jgi:hypothetical protein
MHYIIDVRVDQDKKRTYRINAKDETEAKERLHNRFPPHQRDSLIIDNIKIDMSAMVQDDPYGVFGEE